MDVEVIRCRWSGVEADAAILTVEGSARSRVPERGPAPELVVHPGRRIATLDRRIVVASSPAGEHWSATYAVPWAFTSAVDRGRMWLEKVDTDDGPVEPRPNPVVSGAYEDAARRLAAAAKTLDTVSSGIDVLEGRVYGVVRALVEQVEEQAVAPPAAEIAAPPRVEAPQAAEEAAEPEALEAAEAEPVEAAEAEPIEAEREAEPEPEPHAEPEAEAATEVLPELDEDVLLDEDEESLSGLEPVAKPRRRRLGRRRRVPKPTLPIVLLSVGGLVVADAVTTLAWQEPFTALWAAHQQDELHQDLNQLNKTFADNPNVPPNATAPATLPAKTSKGQTGPSLAYRMARLAVHLERIRHDGQAIGQIKIPSIGASFYLVQGTDEGALERGPGHYPSTVLPGQPGTVGIAGHRTTYLAPFRHIDSLKPRQTISVTMPYGKFTYAVEGHKIVAPNSTWVLQSNKAGSPRLVLTACHPLYSAAQRYVVFAKLIQATPLGAARSTQAFSRALNS